MPPRIDILLAGRSTATEAGNATLATVTLIEVDGVRVMVDTAGYNQRQALEGALHDRGLAPGDVATVVLTHLHWDHCLNYDLFPRAEFVVSRTEVASASRSPRRDGATPHFVDRMLASLPNIRLLNEDAEIAPDIGAWALPGHTEGHIGLVVQTGKGVVVVAADAVPDLVSIHLGRPQLVFSDIPAASESLARVVGSAVAIIPGHDVPLFKTGDGTWSRQQARFQVGLEY